SSRSSGSGRQPAETSGGSAKARQSM
uniref:Pilus protein n=1 Tax=Bursaphelenchus xylophilus TaxID=6326 RepID=A0A1I7SK03_BURXY